MRWLGLRVAPFILCFVFGLFLVTAHRVSQYRLPDTLATPVEPRAQGIPVELSIQHLRFRYWGSGCGGRNVDGSSGSDILFKASDGGIVTHSISRYETRQLARQALRFKLTQAEGVLETGPKVSTARISGKDRVVIKVRFESGRLGAEILWTEGTALNVVAGPTLGDVLGFENLPRIGATRARNKL